MRRAVLGAAAALVLAPAGFASDLLILAGGEQRRGVLASCDDERCQFDGAPVPLAGLLWIGLGVGEDPPPRNIAAPGAVAADGALTTGSLVGLSQGAVVLDTADLERGAVRWLRIAPVPPPVDVLVRRDGALRTGALQGCAAGSCTMAGVAATRAELAWIALAASPESIVVPAPPQDPARDQAQFADGSTRVTPLVGVGAANVVLGSGTFPRAEIAWIYLAPPATEGGPPVYRPGPPSPPLPPPAGSPPGRPGGPGSAPPPDVPPTQPSQPPQPPDTGMPSGPPVCDPQQGMTPGSGAIWTGTARMHQRMSGAGFFDEDRSDFEVKLREACEVPVLDLSVTPARRIGTITWLDSGGTVQHDWHKDEMTGYCLCEGNKTFTEPSWFGGAFYRRTAPGDATAAIAFDLPARSFYSVVLSSTGETMEAPCRGETCSGIGGRTLMQFHAGRYPNLSPEASWDPEVRDLEGGALRGRYTKALGPATLEVSWSICRAGVPCPPPPEGTAPPGPPPAGEEPEPPGDCDETRADRAQLDLKMDQLRTVLGALETATADYARIENQAAQWQGDFNQATWDCRLWGTAQMLASFLLSNFSPQIPGRPLAPAPGRSGLRWTENYEPGKAFANVISLLDKVIENDGSWLLPDYEFDALFGASAEDVWDGFNMGLDAIGPSAPQDLRAGLQSCGAPTLNEVLDGAYEYLRLLEQVKPLADRMHTLLNHARDLDEGIFDFCLSHAKACEDYPRCN